MEALRHQHQDLFTSISLRNRGLPGQVIHTIQRCPDSWLRKTDQTKNYSLERGSSIESFDPVCEAAMVLFFMFFNHCRGLWCLVAYFFSFFLFLFLGTQGQILLDLFPFSPSSQWTCSNLVHAKTCGPYLIYNQHHLKTTEAVLHNTNGIMQR